MSLQRIVLLRHGETAYNRDGRMQGQLNIGLSPLGEQQAQRAAPAISRLQLGRMVSSDLRRAGETARILARTDGRSLHWDARLRETHVGAWQGMTHAEVEAQWPGQLERWRADAAFRPPGGEPKVEVAARARDSVAEIERADPDLDSVLLCAHGGLITALICSLLELPVASWPVLGGIGNCHWSILRRVGRPPWWRLAAHNAGPHGDVVTQTAAPAVAAATTAKG